LASETFEAISLSIESRGLQGLGIIAHVPATICIKTGATVYTLSIFMENCTFSEDKIGNVRGFIMMMRAAALTHFPIFGMHLHPSKFPNKNRPVLMETSHNRDQ
jgi:hypothetical protein